MRNSDRGHNPDRRGHTVIELLLALTIVGILSAVAIPTLRRPLDRIATQGAAIELAALVGEARAMAHARGGGVAVRFDAAGARAIAHAAAETLLVHHYGARHGVALSSTRDSLAYDARGFGVGAANLRVIFTRGAVAETLTVSRLGRVRRQ